MLIEFSKFSPDSGSQKRASDLTWPEFAIYKASRFDRMLGGFGSLLSIARLYKFTNCFFAHDNSHTESNFFRIAMWLRARSSVRFCVRSGVRYGVRHGVRYAVRLWCPIWYPICFPMCIPAMFWPYPILCPNFYPILWCPIWCPIWRPICRPISYPILLLRKTPKKTDWGGRSNSPLGVLFKNG